jgi:hypothetical protein
VYLQALVPEVLKRLTEAERRQPAPSPTQQPASEDRWVVCYKREGEGSQAANPDPASLCACVCVWASSVVAWQESVKMALREAFLCVDEAFLDTLDCRATMVSQSVSQSVSQTASQSVSQSVRQTASQSVRQPVSPSVPRLATAR